MNATRLLQHFERISEAPDAVPRLRRFILNLAVRGKLVEQDPEDESASELLKRIQTEKVRLTKEGKGQKDKLSAPLLDDDLPFSVFYSGRVAMEPTGNNRLHQSAERYRRCSARIFCPHDADSRRVRLLALARGKALA